jgi:hypothetical protein
LINYPDANIILLGDYNDDVDQSVIAEIHLLIKKWLKIPQDTILTLDISKAGASLLSSGGFLDHILSI